MNQPSKKAPDLNLTFGQILRTKIEFKETDTWRNKFLIVVGEDKKAGESLFFITTSQIEKIPPSELVQSSMIHIKPDEVDCFKLATVIDCRTVHRRSRKWFEDLFGKSLLSVRDTLPQVYQDKIKQVVFNTPFISQHHRSIILSGFK